MTLDCLLKPLVIPFGNGVCCCTNHRERTDWQLSYRPETWNSFLRVTLNDGPLGTIQFLTIKKGPDHKGWPFIGVLLICLAAGLLVGHFGAEVQT